MPRYDVYPNPGGEGFLLDIQAATHSHLNTRIVVPLLPIELAPKPASVLNPLFELNGHTYSMLTQYMAAVPVKSLKGRVFNVDDRHADIVAAIDLLLQGF